MHVLLFAGCLFFLPEVFGSVSLIPVKIAVMVGIFLSASPITFHGRVVAIARITGLFVSSIQLHCFSLCADLVFAFLFSVLPLPVFLCPSLDRAIAFSSQLEVFWRFRSALLHTLACELDSCNPQALHLL